MAISATHRYIIRSLCENGLVPRGGALLELGEANWYSDASPLEMLDDIQRHITDPARREYLTAVVHDLTKRCVGDDAVFFHLAKVFYAIFYEPEEIQAIDFHGTGLAQKLDLNHPIQLSRRFNVVMNHGTAEHVFNIAQVFRTIHEYTLPEGLMIHESPFYGWVDHGFYTLQPTLYFDLAEANQYQVLGMFITELKAKTLCQVRTREEVYELSRSGQIPENAQLFVVFRQSAQERPFQIPWQGYYRKALSPEGEDAWRRLR